MVVTATSHSRSAQPGDRIPTWAFYAATVTTGGLTWFAIRLQIGIVPLEVSVVYRFVVAAAVLLAFAVKSRLPLRFGIATHLRIALLGALMFAGSFSLLYLASEHLTSGLVALVFSTVLLMNVANGALFLGRPFEVRVVLGAGLGLCGLGAVFWREIVHLDLADNRTTAIAQVLAAAALFSFGNMISARLQSKGIPVLVSTAFAMAYGAFLLALLAFAMGRPFLFDDSPTYILSLAYLALIGTVVGYVTYFIVLGRIGPERAAYSLVLTPALALTISTLLEDFTWTGRGLLGIALVVIGNVTVLTRRKLPDGDRRCAELDGRRSSGAPTRWG
jgi:drug/metabolite transporter (DMT)-like permease